MQTPGAPGKAYVLVEYEFEYIAKDGQKISIKPNERYILLKRTNDHWWHVRKDDHSKPFYIPAKYVKELSSGIWSSNGLQSHSDPNERLKVPASEQSSGESLQYSYKFIANTSDTPCNPYVQKSNVLQLPHSLSGSDSKLSIPDISVIDDKFTDSTEDLFPQIGEERFRSSRIFTPLRTFGSFHRLHLKKAVCGPEFSSPTSIRSSQSLDDLARLPSERQIGGRRSDLLASSMVHSRSLTKSESDNIYETIQDLPGKKVAMGLQAEETFKLQKNPSNEAIAESFPRLPQQHDISHSPERGHVSEGYGSRPKAQKVKPRIVLSPEPPFLILEEVISPEKDSCPVYANVEELRLEAAKSGTSSRLHSSSSTLEEWETHTDQGSGQLFYYNTITGETTWESPFYQPEDQGTSPGSIASATSPIDSEWEKHFDEHTGCFFFHNSSTGETSWQSPEQEEFSPQDMKPVNSPFNTMEQRPPTPEADYPEYSPDYDAFPEEDYSPRKTGSNFIFPIIQPEKSPTDYNVCQLPGWSCEITKDGETVYTHNYTKEMWIMSRDGQGKTFFHTPDGSESQWTLPQESEPLHRRHNSDYSPLYAEGNQSNFQAQTKSLDKAGILHKTKVAENGKRLRKNWSSSWTVLEGPILTFYKDTKNLSTGSLKQSSNFSTPEFTVELRGASLRRAPREKSSKKNVLELKTRGGSEYLIQHDSDDIAAGWYEIISDSIQAMSTELSADNGDNSQVFGSTERLEGNSKEKEEKEKKTQGQKSFDANMDGDSNKVRNKLKRLLQKRPTLQALREKGYIRDQVFGCHLHVLCEREKTLVPKFVKQCIQTVEHRGLDIDGLYRISGNLATIQKLRFNVDHEENLNLDDCRWEDVHVITGALKLFFRELPEPLFPYSHFERFVSAIKITDPKVQLKNLKELVQSLPLPNLETMKVLFQHLCRVIERREENRMSVKSVAIVFGPTLLKKETESGNMAMHMVFQNQIVEQILSQCNYIFADS